MRQSPQPAPPRYSLGRFRPPAASARHIIYWSRKLINRKEYPARRQTSERHLLSISKTCIVYLSAPAGGSSEPSSFAGRYAGLSSLPPRTLPRADAPAHHPLLLRPAAMTIMNKAELAKARQRSREGGRGQEKRVWYRWATRLRFVLHVHGLRCVVVAQHCRQP